MKAAMKKKIHALDFSILELTLYLDTHPSDKRALHKRHELIAERRSAVAAYEEKFGPYTVTADKVTGDCWSWVNDPWPWEYTERTEM